MSVSVVVDTGPIVALLVADDSYHAWAVAQFTRLRPPLLTCEAVLTESCFLLERVGAQPERVPMLVERGVLSVVSLFHAEAAEIARMIRKYADVPMSLADASLLRLVELTPNASLLTVDSDFRIYRQKNRRVVPVVMPDS